MAYGSLDRFALGAQAGEHGVDAVLVDRAQGVGGQAQAHPAVLALHPKAATLQVGEETTLRLVVRVRDVVAHDGALTGDLTDSSHGSLLRMGGVAWRSGWDPGA